MSNDYTIIDTLIIEAIKTERSPHYSHAVSEQADRLAKTGPWGQKNPFRVTDRRLQALRKAWKIVADRKVKCGWRLV